MKKIMKKALISGIVVIVLVCAFMLSAFAASYEHLADDLKDLGLFRGTDIGYELDRAPNRDEALVMLIRLLGLEDAALSGDYENPFDDVPDWFAPYAGYAYEFGLTDGISATQFGPKLVCTSQMYVTYVLRALGYDDKAGDFTYAGAVEFGKSVGVTDDLLASGAFLRDQMVAISYLALNTAPKGGEFDTLLAKLIDAGAVSEADAGATLNKLAMIREYLAASTATDDMTRIAMVMSMDMKMALLGQSVDMVMDTSVKRIEEDSDILIEMSMDISAMGESDSITMYIVDGYVYMDDGVNKIKMAADDANVSGMVDMADINMMSISPAYSISGISKSAEDGYTVYTIVFAEGFSEAVISQASGLLGSSELDAMGMSDISVNALDVKVYIDSAGVMSKTVVTMDMVINMDVMGTALSVPCTAVVGIEIVATGDDVTISLPDDLDTYILS